jgi:hypothetical protein
MKYIYDEDITKEELMKYVEEYSETQAKDARAFMEILRLTENEDIGAFEALIKIAGICKECLLERHNFPLL